MTAKATSRVRMSNGKTKAKVSPKRFRASRSNEHRRFRWIFKPRCVGLFARPYSGPQAVQCDVVIRRLQLSDGGRPFAFAAGAELYLKELRSRFKSIKWMTAGQLIVTFVLSTIIIVLISTFSLQRSFLNII